MTVPKELEGVSDEEAIRRLRLLGHPATLFGETGHDRLLRLHVVQRNLTLEAQLDVGEGQQANEVQRLQRALAKEAAEEARQDKPGTADASAEEDDVAAAFRAAAAALAAQRAEASATPAVKTATHLKRLVEEWEAEVNSKIDSLPGYGASLEGRNAVSTMRLTKEHVKPLLRMLKRGKSPQTLSAPCGASSKL